MHWGRTEKISFWRKCASFAPLAALFWHPSLRVEGQNTPSSLAQEFTQVAAASPSMRDPFELSLEELLRVPVFSVSRELDQTWFSSPAAIYVITPDEIRRSGHQYLPELLRLAPGMHVARADASTWAVSARGLNGRFNSLQLVQMDGRTLYTPTFGGVIWGAQDTVIEDLEQIEVIRGPGGSLWGANAVNGIINITSKSAADTQGWLLSTTTGNDLSFSQVARYGGTLGDNAHYRVYGKHSQVAGTDTSSTPAPYTDDGYRNQAGFRIDWAENDRDTFTLQGDIYDFSLGSSFIGVAGGTDFTIDGNKEYDGYNVLSRWKKATGDDSDLIVQVYYDAYELLLPGGGGQTPYSHQVSIFDIDVQHNFRLAEGHEIVWGAGYRNTRAQFSPSAQLGISVTTEHWDEYQFFLQDSIALQPDVLELVLGIKLFDSGISGFDYSPGARLVWTPDRNHTLWMAASRAVRTPTPMLQHINLTLTNTGPTTLLGNPDLDSTSLLAGELGYRVKLDPTCWLDVAVFHNDYNRLYDPVLINPAPPTLQQFSNTHSQYYGFEVSANWQAAENWRWVGTYTSLRQDPGDQDSPEHQFSIRSWCDLTRRLEWNTALYFSSPIPDQNIGEIWRLDTGFTWRGDEGFELALIGQNLLDRSHLEIPADGFVSRATSEIPRSWVLKATWRY